MWTYTLIVLALWIVNPELRRLLEWRTGFSSVDILSVLPLLATFPHLLVLRSWNVLSRSPNAIIFAAWCWLGSLLYGLVCAVVSGNTAAGLYAFSNVVLPTTLGIWIASSGAGPLLSRAHLERVLFPMTTFVALYGLVQYVFVPPWDGYWLANAGIDSAGRPFPFQIRVFSTLNAPGPFGTFMAFALLFALPQYSLRRPLLLLQLSVWTLALTLSLDRSAWLAVLLGVVFYAILSGQLRQTSLAMIAFVSLAIGLTLGLPILTGNDATTLQLSDRFSTLTDLSEDRSARDRQGVYLEGTDDLLSSPLGRGLGTVGTAAKLGNAQATIDFDSGYLTQLIELGFPGGCLFFTAIASLIYGCVMKWRDVRFSDVVQERRAASFAVAFSLAMLGLNISGDVFSGLGCLLFWIVAGSALGAGRGSSESPRLLRVSAAVAPR